MLLELHLVLVGETGTDTQLLGALALGTTAGVGLGVGTGETGGTEVLEGLTAGTATADQEGVLAGGGLEGQLVEGDALTASTLNTVAGRAGEAEGADLHGGDLDGADIIQNVTDNDGGGGLGLLQVHPAGLATEDGGEAGQASGGTVDTALQQASVDCLVEAGGGAGGQLLVQLNQQLDSVIGASDQLLVETGNVGHGKSFAKIRLDQPFMPASTLVDVTIYGRDKDVLLARVA